MTEAHQRKKQPEKVRKDLLDCAAKIAAEQGLANLTLDAVAKAAGVTKGGLFHHFSNKKMLVDAMFENLLSQFDQQLDAYMDNDTTLYGRFTRAYVEMVFAEGLPDPSEPWASWCMSTMSEPVLQKIWAEWLNKRLELHSSTDNSPMLQIVRLATDGAWLAMMTQMHCELVPDPRNLRTRLLALTKQPDLAD